MVLNLEQIARALGGEISGNQVLDLGQGISGEAFTASACLERRHREGGTP